ncbi:MAG TPA: RNB domain-containing ribonuclease, partial [bacterium]|nr:RNB domain-containing ribonuclease [bacterium]
MFKKRNHKRRVHGEKPKNQKSQAPHGKKNRFFQKSHSQSPAASQELIGAVQANEKGFGFFIPEDGSPDAFLPPHQMRGILNGDVIRARVFKDPRKEDKFAAEFLSIVKRAHTNMVGTLFKDGGRDFLKPDDFRVTQPILLKGGFQKGQVGQKAVAKITQWPGNGFMQGEVIEILGFPGDPGVDIKSVIRKYNWPEQFQKQVTAQVQNLPEDPTPQDWEGRMDLRRLPILTIDGADAKDFDDAISLEKQPGGRYRLGVHIADVAHYVREGTPLDAEATERATSLYLADRVLPMLPHSLSDGLCSLKEGVPRLTLSAFLTYDSSGRLLSTEFAESVIQSGRRGIYEEVQAVLDSKASAEVRSKYASLQGMLGDMVVLSR